MCISRAGTMPGKRRFFCDSSRTSLLSIVTLHCVYDNTSVIGTVRGLRVQLDLRDWHVQVWDLAHRLVPLGWEEVGTSNRFGAVHF